MKTAVRSFVIGIFLFFSFFLSSIVSPSAFAQTYSQDQAPQSDSVATYFNTNADSDVPHNLHSLFQIFYLETASSLGCQLVGIDPIDRHHQCLGLDTQTGKIGYVQSNGGVIGMLEKGIAFTFYPPAHTGDYFAYLGNEFGDHAYAATGEGFTNLQPLLSTWVAFRNVAYLIFVLAFVIIGIGIMLRIQIDPRTVMTIENQLPKIVIGLILVTFSFAIAGFMIDLMWVLIFLIINILQSADPTDHFAQNATVFLFQIPMEYFDRVFGNFISFFTQGHINGSGGGGILFLTTEVTTAALRFVQNSFVPATTHQLQVANIPGLPGNTCQIFNPGSIDWGKLTITWPSIDIDCFFTTLIGQIINLILTTFIALLGWIIVFIALIVMLIRVWIALLKTYVYIILAIVLAPFFIIGGIIPGGSFGFGAWMKMLIANLLVFPAIIFLFLLAMVINDQFVLSNSFNSLTGSPNFFTPPLVGNPADSSFVGGNGNLNIPINPLGAFLVFGVIMIAPGVPNTINKMLGNEGTGLGGMVFGGLGMAAAGPTRLASGGWNMLTGPQSIRYERTGPGGAVQMVEDTGVLAKFNKFLQGARK